MTRANNSDRLGVSPGEAGTPKALAKRTRTLKTSADTQPAAATDWEAEARHILKAEMERRGVTLKELSRRLESVGSSDTPKAIGMRINRGTFSFAFALRVFRVLGVTKPDLSELPNAKTNT